MRCPRARKLTDAQAREVLSTPDISARAWARHFGVTTETILNIRNGVTYRHVYDEVAPPRKPPVRERRLTDAQAQEVIDTPEISQDVWAQRLGVSQTTISFLRKGIYYKHLKRPKPSKPIT